MGEPDKTWNTEDLDFDDNGRLVLKNPALVEAIKYHFNKSSQLIITINDTCTFVPKPPPNVVMCHCVAIEIEDSIRTILQSYDDYRR